MSNEQGCLFFNFGGGCVVRLLVALHSLRRLYSGPVTVFLQTDDQWNQQAEPEIRRYADVRWIDFSQKARRNIKCAIKPFLFRHSPYQHSLMFDGDLLFQQSPQPLLDLLINGRSDGLLLTRFSTWNTDGGKMQKRVRNFYPWLRPHEQALLDAQVPGWPKIPAINLGVCGWSRGQNQVLDTWEWLMEKKSGMHLADEVSANCVCAIHKVLLAESRWNESCLYRTDDPSKAAILHFHGSKHCGYRPSSWRWVKYLAEMLEAGSTVDRWFGWDDRSLQGFLRENPRWREAILKHDRIEGPGWIG